ncbi:lysophospholipid acyltransferase family protein [Candidatus Sumerlaeota bacterium]|nr:lysophospholipid acyltransferase family protein [Candidatus Sumerlaeota bacterium]
MSHPSKTKHRKKRNSLRARAQYRLEYAAFRLTAAVLSRIPFHIALKLGAGLGGFCFRVLGIRKKIVMQNLQRAFPGKSEAWRRDTALRHFRNAGMLAVEVMLLRDIANLPEAEFSRRIELHGEEHLRALGWGEQPYVMCTAHTGNWELDGIFAGRREMNFSALVKRIHNPHLDRWINDARQCTGTRTIYLKKIKSVYRHVRDSRGGICFLNDQDARKQGEFIEFFGRPASTFAGPAFFALKFGIPFVPIFQYRRPDDPARHVIVVQPPIQPPEQLQQDEQLHYLLIEFNRRLEDFIREHPDQYFWMHNRWKTQPKKPV